MLLVVDAVLFLEMLWKAFTPEMKLLLRFDGPIYGHLGKFFMFCLQLRYHTATRMKTFQKNKIIISKILSLSSCCQTCLNY